MSLIFRLLPFEVRLYLETNGKETEVRRKCSLFIVTCNAQQFLCVLFSVSVRSSI